ncbi:MAG: rRNA maturation RNase YbeY [Epsilonproteobacteria bacterium]|nr:rRNA maturation RNase YbeY [Campylobacterota bacterium]
MITIKNFQRKFTVNSKDVQTTVHAMLEAIGYVDFDLSIVFVSKKKIRELNKQYRCKDRATDILSFPFHDIKAGEKITIQHEDEKNLGDLIVCPEYTAQDAATNWSCSYLERLPVLLAHGIAHLLGHDHINDVDYKKMQKIEHMMLKAVRN